MNGSTNSEKFEQVLGKLDIKNFMSIDDIIKLNPELKLGNGGSWLRSGNALCKKYKMVTVKNNKEIRYLFDATYEEKNLIENEVSSLKFYKKGNSIQYIRILPGKSIIKETRSDITLKLKKIVMDEYNNKCVFCGSSNVINIDHKDDEYTSYKKELTNKDLQLLCQHCNTIKRSGSRHNRIDKELPPFLEPIRELEKYLEYDPKYIKGDNKNISRFWYDPKNWMQKHIQKIIDMFNEKDKRINELLEHNNEKDKRINELLELINKKK
jgi:hypothetical protein